jgi:hypothetical protein
VIARQRILVSGEMHDLADVGEDRLRPRLERRDLAATGKLFGNHG